jgi:cell division protein ZapA
MNSLDSQDSKISIRLLEKTFQIKCPPEQIEALQKAADYLDKEMRKMRESGVVGLDRIAIIAALNMANQINEGNARDARYENDFSEKVRSLELKISEALSHTEQLEVPLEV